MNIINFLWMVGVIAVIGIIYNYIQLKKEERKDARQ
jgi:hypothetical protein